MRWCGWCWTLLLLSLFCSGWSLALVRLLDGKFPDGLEGLASLDLAEVWSGELGISVMLSFTSALLIVVAATCCCGASATTDQRAAREHSVRPTEGIGEASTDKEEPLRASGAEREERPRTPRDGDCQAQGELQPKPWRLGEIEKLAASMRNNVLPAATDPRNAADELLIGTWYYDDGAGGFRLTAQAPGVFWFREDMPAGHAFACMTWQDGFLCGALLLSDDDASEDHVVDASEGAAARWPTKGAIRELGHIRMAYDDDRDALVYGIRCFGESVWRAEQVALRSPSSPAHQLASPSPAASATRAEEASDHLRTRSIRVDRESSATADMVTCTMNVTLPASVQKFRDGALTCAGSLKHLQCVQVVSTLLEDAEYQDTSTCYDVWAEHGTAGDVAESISARVGCCRSIAPCDQYANTANALVAW